ncbi:MAG: GIY-YIG nuclease family protein [Fimbriimonadaceae bacterium]
MPKKGYCYIVTNKPHGVLYTGVTSDLIKRVHEHRHGVVPGFTKRYNLTILVWAEEFPTIVEAIIAEKRIKKWKRAYKVRLIESKNPDWIELNH